MKRIADLYIAWLIAAVMLSTAIIGPPAINFGSFGRTSSYTGRSRYHSYGRSYYSQRKDFYTLLRWICCVVFAYSAFIASGKNRVPWAWVSGLLAVLFNPIVPVRLQRDTWQIVDWVQSV